MDVAVTAAKRLKAKVSILPEWGVKCTVTDAIFVHGKSGVGLRFTLSISASHPEYGVIQQSTQGCLAFRNRKNEINVLTPIIYIGPAKVRFRPITLSPGANAYLKDELEKSHGHWIKRNEEKDKAPAGVAASFFGAPTELDLSEDLT